jgi:hypothetical protein
MAHALYAVKAEPRTHGLHPRHEPSDFETIDLKENAKGLARPCAPGRRSEKHVRFDPRVVDVAGIGRPGPLAKERKGAFWLVCLIYGVIFVLVVGLMVSVATGVKRPPKGPTRGTRSAGPGAVDCVRIVSSPNSSLVDGALDEIRRIGLESRHVTVQSLPLDAGSHKRGCYTAHVAAHAWAVEHGCTNTLVLEDDVVFAEDAAAAWRPVDRFLASGVEFSTLWLGYVAIRRDPVPAFPGIAHIQKPMLAHAIVFSRAASERIAALPPWTPREISILDAYDVALWHENVTEVGATFGADPPLAAQLPSQPHSYSPDKNWLQDFVKTFTGMRALNYLGSGKCSPIYRLSPAAERVVGLFTSFGEDTRSIHRVYTCDDVASADELPDPRGRAAQHPGPA